MTKTNTITSLIERLTTLNNNDHGCSESSNRRTKEEAQDAVRLSELDSDTAKSIIHAIGSASNPSGWYYTCNGIKAGLETLKAALNEFEVKDHANTPATDSDTGFNLRNLQNLVSDGSIFYVEFIKRSTGALRKMKCRTGVRKRLKGGAKGYSAKAKGLLTVFDMQAKGYRSIPVDAIERLTICGQSFNFAGVCRREQG